MIVILIIFLFSLIIIGNVSAEDIYDDNSTNNKLNGDYANNDMLLIENNVNKLESDDCCGNSSAEDINSTSGQGSKTWIVTPDPENPNQVQKPTVQPVINQANSGDTIILNGTFIHCHFVVNKTLNIIATPGTTVGICPHHNLPAGSDTYGVFYITPEASGTVLDGFGFTNNFYHVGFGQYNPFAVLIDGASDVELKNLIVNWTGVKVDGNDKDPQDYIFNPIIIKNALNIDLVNLFINNTLNAVQIENSTNVSLRDSTVINSKSMDVFSKNDNANISVININPIKEEISPVKEIKSTKITVSTLKTYVGDSAKLKISLKDDDGNLLNQTVLITINGVTKKVTTKNGVGTLNVKYSKSGTNYVTVVYLGDESYKASQSISKIVVSKKATKISSPSKKTFKLKSTKKLTVVLKNGKKLIKGKVITIKVNGKLFKAKTNSKGVATIKIKLTKKGTFKYTARFAGDATYKAISKTGKIVVKK